MVTLNDADATRARIVTAATDEFARFGIAGARIERIASRAKTSKERLYAHFRGKQELYRFIAERALAAMAEATRLDATDLPAYAGRVHDHFVAHPDHLRLLQWGRMDLADPEAAIDPFQDALRRTVQHDLEQLRRAQAAGQLDPSWDPVDILVMVNQLAVAWSWAPDLVDLAESHARDSSGAARRAAIVAAVARLFPATADPATPPSSSETDSATPVAARADRGGPSCATG